MAEMTPERIAEIKARAAKATPGAWRFMRVEKPRRGEWYSDEILATTQVAATYPGHQVRTDHSGGVSPLFDGQFIAHARQDIPDLLDALERAQQEIADLREALQSVLPVLEWKHAPDYARVPAVTRIKAALATHPPGETGGTT